MRADLQRLKRDSESGHLTAASSGKVAVAETSAARVAKLWKIGVPVLLVVVLVAGALYYRSHQSKPLTDKDTIVLADFVNSTGDAIFDDTLKTALTVSLRQSPFLNVLSESEVAKTLQQMTRRASTKTHARSSPRALPAGGQQGLHCWDGWRSGQRICAGLEGSELPQRRLAGARAGGGCVQGESARRPW